MSVSLGYKLSYEITIGKYLFKNDVSSVEIRSSWKELTDTATITLPRNMYILKDNKKIDFSRELITDSIQKGDKVEIKLGYNGQNDREFIGYVKETEAAIPFVVHCEDEMMMLKKNPLTIGYETVSLKGILSKIAPNYGVICPDVDFSKYTIQNATPARVLEDLKSFNLYAWFDLNGVLHCGFPYADKYNTHIFSFQHNIRENNLKYIKADSVSLKVKAIANKKNGKKEVYEFGDGDGEIRTLNYGDIPLSQLKQFAEAEVKRFKFDGYQGDFTGWGWPKTRHGDIAKIRDKRYPEHEGSYIIDGVTISFGDDGFKRVNSLGPRV